MKPGIFLRTIIAIACLAAPTSVLAQTNSVQLFGPANVRPSTDGAGFGQNQLIFNSSTILLSCGTSPHASLSSSADGTANLLVDNYLNVTVTAGDSSSGPTNVCRGGTSDSTPDGVVQDCFTSSYRAAALAGTILGQDPDTFVSTGGVAPIDISGGLQPGLLQLKIDLADAGVFLASSTIYLNTSCTILGITGPAKITGNPIPQNNPSPSQLTQDFSFNPTNDKKVQFIYDLSVAQSAGELSITDNTIPNTADIPIDPAAFQPVWVPGTSFATSSCLIHTGELLPNGQPACKLYTLECQVGTSANESGAQCPISQLRNEIFTDAFDGPAFTLPDIIIPNGPTFHQGFGLLMAKEGWTGGSCIFDPAAGLGTELCPQNLLTNFSGPGFYADDGIGDHPNSTFISVAPVPEDLTTVTVADQHPGGWINSQTASVTFSSQPPNLSGLQPALPGQGAFVPAPIKSITFGTALASAIPQPSPRLPIPTDTVLPNSIPCPSSSNPTQPSATTFAPPTQSVSFNADGQYFLHYFAQDCAGTEELKFSQDAGSSWSTTFYTVPINIDTVKPTISGPTLSPASPYTLNQQHVMATYSCSDDRSGIVTCGTSTFPPGTLNTGQLTSPVDTSTPGMHSFVVNAIDAAGNHTSSSASYQVVAAQADLAVAKLAPLLVRHGDTFTYTIAAFNLGGATASQVTVSDPLPAGATFISATSRGITCTIKGCSRPSGGTSCSFTNNTVTCIADSLAPLSWSQINIFAIQIVVRADAPKGTAIKNTAYVSSANADSQPGNNQSTAITWVW
jgi:uncharacterized repeat protein (TIGR01451 family)